MRCHRSLIVCLLFVVVSSYYNSSCIAGTIFYVDCSVTSGGGGTSWSNAFKYLQEALDAAGSGDEIRVAQGTYKPDQDRTNPGGSGDRSATFSLKSGVALYGGYAGMSVPNPDLRDINTYETILSGDIGTTGDNSDNSFHVVLSTYNVTAAIMDGFSITYGNALNAGTNDGGGMLNYGGSTVTNCVFSNNRGNYGGGIKNKNDDFTLTNCTFIGNSALNLGGGLMNSDCSPTVERCVFSNNSAMNGGAAANQVTSATFINCTFIGNSASWDGGGLENDPGSPALINCLFSGNSATNLGGGLSTSKGSPILTNCTFSGNSARQGGGIRLQIGATNTLTNCILWGNSDNGGMDESAQIHNDNVAVTVVNNSCIQGWTGSMGGTGNINDDPLFRNADGDDGIVGTEDDNLRLIAGSPCIDEGDDTAVAAAGIINDLDGGQRTFDYFNDGPPDVDMGAYELQCVPPPSDLVAWWSFDDHANDIASLAANSSGSIDDDGQLEGNAGFITGGMVDGALTLDGNGDYVTVDDSVDLNFGTGNFTIDAWIRYHGSSTQTIVGKREGANPYRGYLLLVYSNNCLLLQLNDNQNWRNHLSTLTVPQDEWAFVAVSVDRNSNPAVTFYVNGQTAQSSDSALTGDTSNQIALEIGKDSAGTSYFNGQIDELEFFKRALTTDELDDIYIADSAGKCKDVCGTPTPATCVSPLDGSCCVELDGDDIVLQWTPGNNIVEQTVTITGQGVNNSITFTDGTTSSWPVQNLQIPCLEYEWTIESIGCDGTPIIAGPWTFTTWDGVTTEQGAHNRSPADGTTNLCTDDVTLRWDRGCCATEQWLFLGAAKSDVENAGITNTMGLFVGRMGPLTIRFDIFGIPSGQTYYWKIITESACGMTETDVWGFTTGPASYCEDIDNMESYTNASGTNPIFETWADGFEDLSNGSLVGNNPTGQISQTNIAAPETSIVHSGSQSITFNFENTGDAHYSEIEREFDPSVDFTQYNVQYLVIYFYGDPANAVLGNDTFYAKINSIIIPYDDISDLTEHEWHTWCIDLSSINASRINTLSLVIGDQSSSTPSESKGKIYIDDIKICDICPPCD